MDSSDRQQILADCLARPAVVRELYALAVEALEREKRVWGVLFDRYPEGILHRAIEVLQLLMDPLRRLRGLATAARAHVRSEGFMRLFDMLARELDEEYLTRIENHLRRLTFPSGVPMSARLGPGLKGTQYVLHTPRQAKPSWLARLQTQVRRLFLRDRSGYVVQVADRDENGFKALSELRGRGVSLVAGALRQAADQVVNFFSLLRLELGFYVGCLNLHDRLAAKGEPICFPEPLASGAPMLSCRGLYDPCLSLSVGRRVVGNAVNADGKALVMITGANRGGKSTFLRSLGLAQLMMQCGMFVPAEQFRADVRDRIFTHFTREEDADMRRGKLDEELYRMSTIIDALTPNSLVLLNESFASTNEREGSEIARQIVRALVESGVKVFYVTHLYDLAQRLSRAKLDGALFLRAERLADWRCTFRLVEGDLLPTSYGEDLYRRIFGAVPDIPAAGARHEFA